MVYVDDVPTAFLTASIDTLAPDIQKQKTAFFMHFISKNNPKAVEKLFHHAGKWCKENGASVIRGPMSSSLSDYRGILISGFSEPPCLGLPHNPDYYDALLHSSGLIKAMDMFSYRIKTGTLGKVSRVAMLAKFRNPRIAIRNFDINNVSKEIKDIVSIYNKAWKKQWSFIPVTEKDFSAAIESMSSFFDPEMVKLAVIGDQVIGVMVSVPNVFNSDVMESGKPLYARGMLFGVDSNYQKRGIDALLMDAAIKMCTDKGVLAYEVGWVLESNVHWKRQLETACKDYLLGIRKYRIFDYLIK